jgi:hypothetical protein
VRDPVFPTALIYRAKRVRHSLEESNNSPETHPCTELADFREVLEAIIKGCPSGRWGREPRGRRRGRRRCFDGWRVLIITISNELREGGNPTYPDVLLHLIKDNFTIFCDSPQPPKFINRMQTLAEPMCGVDEGYDFSAL